MKRTPKITISSVYESTRRRGSTKLANVFVDYKERPIRNGDVEGDFEWRRTHKPPRLNRKIAEAVYAEVASVFSHLFDVDDECSPAILKVNYSRYAGCNMCPCSPGFEVRLRKAKGSARLAYQTWRYLDIWVEVDYDS